MREHLQAVAERMEAELGEERQPDPVKPEEDTALPLPDGPMTVGLDGGYVRAAHKEGFFEVIAGRSVVAFRRREGDAVPPPKCFGFVQTYDPKPRRRLMGADEVAGDAGESASGVSVRRGRRHPAGHGSICIPTANM